MGKLPYVVTTGNQYSHLYVSQVYRRIRKMGKLQHAVTTGNQYSHLYLPQV